MTIVCSMVCVEMSTELGNLGLAQEGKRNLLSKNSLVINMNQKYEY